MGMSDVWEHGDWRVSWEGLLDRHACSIAMRSRDEWIPLLRSYEGTSVDRWPPSPPLQQLVIDPGTGVEVLLGVGMSGTSHWSLSYSTRSSSPNPSPAGDGVTDEESLCMEAACRLGQAVDGWLGSQFLVAQGIELRQADGLEFWRRGERLAAMAGDHRSKVEWLGESSLLKISPQSWSQSRYPCTVQWGWLLQSCNEKT